MPRPIRKNRKPRYCPKCGGTMVKRGFYNGRQQWRCRECKYTTVRPEMTILN